MKKLVSILIISCVCIATTLANNPIDDLKTRYPNADAVFFRLKKTYTLNADGSVDFHYYHQLAYLKPYAFNSQYGESFVVYNPDFQSLKIISAKTYTPDGRIISAPSNAFNEVLPSSAANAPAFTHLREMVISHTGLETGAMVQLEYVIHSNAGFSNGLVGNESLMMASPVEELQFEITTPTSVKLNVASFNIPSQAQVDVRETVQRYSWKLSNIASEAAEPMVSASSKPRIVFATQPMTNDLKAINKSVGAKVNAEFNTWVKTTTAITDTLAKKALALQKAVVEDINTYPVTLEQAAYRYRNVMAVFQSNGGTELEKTILLAKALKNIGLKVKVVATMPAWMKNKENVMNLQMLNHFYVRANVDNKTIHLSAIEMNKTDDLKLLEEMIIID